MLTAKPKTKRFLESIQFVLTFASACALIETTRIPASLLQDPPGYSRQRAAAERRAGRS